MASCEDGPKPRWPGRISDEIAEHVSLVDASVGDVREHGSRAKMLEWMSEKNA